MAKTSPPVPETAPAAAEQPAPPAAGMTDADRDWVKEQIAAARADLMRRQKVWVRRELALHGSGVSEAEREKMNP